MKTPLKTPLKTPQKNAAANAAARRRTAFKVAGGLVALGGLGGLGGVTAAWFAGGGGSGSAVERALWLLRFPRPEGGMLDMADLRGQPLLINFWATWCPPCIQELPLLDAFWREHAAKGWQVVGLAVDKQEPVQHFLKHVPLGFPIGLTGLEGVELSRSLGNEGGGLPFSVALNADGRIVQRKIGRLASHDLQVWAVG